MIVVERCRAVVFGVTMYFAVCHICQCWVKSGVGQFCWTQRSQRNAMAVAHTEFHEAHS